MPQPTETALGTVAIGSWQPPSKVTPADTTQGVSMPSTPELQPGDTVRVTDGPFAQFTGPVRAIDRERNRIQLVVQAFGDDTRIDVPLDVVEKVPNV